ncbi:MAG: uncharacterized protein JWN35_2650 [Frankiales bacterium]|nr:uncharacterized protein [Frankiales bacterium]
MTAAQTERPLALPTPDIAALAGLRLLPAPDSEPPYDDERPGGRPLPLRATGLAATAPRPLRLVPSPLLDEDDRWDAVQRTRTSDLPPAKAFAHALVQRLLEVCAGVRPLAQLQRDTTLAVYDALEGQLSSRPRPTGARPDGRAVRSVHVQERPDGVAEVSATVRRGGRYAAVALRLEGIEGQWRCTELVGA